MMSSRQFWGLYGWNSALFAPMAFVKELAEAVISEYTLAIALPSAVRHCGVMTLAVMVQPAGAFGGVLSVNAGSMSLKLPCSSAEVGTVIFCGLWEMRIFFHS